MGPAAPPPPHSGRAATSRSGWGSNCRRVEREMSSERAAFSSSLMFLCACVRIYPSDSGFVCVWRLRSRAGVMRRHLLHFACLFFSFSFSFLLSYNAPIGGALFLGFARPFSRVRDAILTRCIYIHTHVHMYTFGFRARGERRHQLLDAPDWTAPGLKERVEDVRLSLSLSLSVDRLRLP